MTASQVTALSARSSLCGQTGTGSTKLSLPETVCLGAQSCLSPLQLLHWMFQGKISASKTVFCILYLWKTFNSSPEDMRLLSWHPDVAWAEPDLGKCWAKFPAPGGDTGWCLLSLPKIWTWEHSDEQEVHWGHRPHTNMGGDRIMMITDRESFPASSQSHKVPGCQSQWSVPEVKRNKLN